MTKTMLCLAAVALLATGCGQDEALKTELAKTRTEAGQLRADKDAAQKDLAAANGRIELLEGERNKFRAEAERLGRVESALDAKEAAELILQKKADSLQARVTELEAQVAKGKTEPEKPGDEKTTETTTPAEVKQQAEQLITRLRANPGDRKLLGELKESLLKADKESRQKAVDELKSLVAAEPENKQARVALAQLMTLRFRDLKNPMDQGALAGDIKGEIGKVLEQDSEFYDAVHFMAILKSHYPPFADEFKTAGKDLDRALELQAKLPWEDRFAQIYASYSSWLRRQNKLDEAAVKLQAGLDKAPQYEDLLEEKKALDEAKAAAKPGSGG